MKAKHKEEKTIRINLEIKKNLNSPLRSSAGKSLRSLSNWDALWGFFDNCRGHWHQPLWSSVPIGGVFSGAKCRVRVCSVSWLARWASAAPRSSSEKHRMRIAAARRPAAAAAREQERQEKTLRALALRTMPTLRSRKASRRPEILRCVASLLLIALIQRWGVNSTKWQFYDTSLNEVELKYCFPRRGSHVRSLQQNNSIMRHPGIRMLWWSQHITT